MAKKQYLETGKIVTTHGIKGEVKVYPWCDTPEFLLDFDVFYLNKGKTPIEVEDCRIHKNMAILKKIIIKTNRNMIFLILSQKKNIFIYKQI